MGVYIDIEMPKGELGAIPIMIYANGNVEHFFSHEKYGKAIEVPAPHGRLIDADEARSRWLAGEEDVLFNAPTVMSESEEE